MLRIKPRIREADFDTDQTNMNDDEDEIIDEVTTITVIHRILQF